MSRYFAQSHSLFRPSKVPARLIGLDMFLNNKQVCVPRLYLVNLEL